HHRGGFAMQSLPQEESRWHDLLADDSITPILDQVCFRMDWCDFLRKQSPRHRRIVHLLGMGHAAKFVAKNLNISPARVTQLRKELRRQWLAFIGDSGCTRVNENA